jgi:hypothetical protein
MGLSSFDSSCLARSSNSIVQAKVAYHFLERDTSARILQSLSRDSNVFQVFEAREDGFAEKCGGGLSGTLRALFNLAREFIGDLNGGDWSIAKSAYRPWFSRNFSASRAAMQPVAAAVMA